MSTEHIEFEPVTLSPGWEASDAWVPGGPIVLIHAQSAQGDAARSRFDVHKAMFIDPMPFEVTPEGTRELAGTVIAARRSTS
jgi:hypothetical protein